MRASIVVAACFTLVAIHAAQADEAAFRARKAAKAPKAAASQDAVVPAQEPYLARKGDTLWDVSSRFWRDPWAWPELWSLNPHFRNPHRVDPGDPIFLTRGGRGQEIRLTVEAASSGGAQPMDRKAAGGDAAQTEPGASGAASTSLVPIRVTRAQAGHFVSSHQLPRLGTIANRYIMKTIYTAGDDTELALPPDTAVKPGDLLTLFDDSRKVTHPVNKTPQGYLVLVLAHARVLSVKGGVATCKIFESYEGVTDGMGATAYRKPVTQIEPQATKVGVEGVVLAGLPHQSLLGLEDVVFLDRGSIHGLQPGALLEVPIPEVKIYLGAMLDLQRPVARIAVVSVQDKTATGLVIASRANVVPGIRFVAAPVSP